MDPWGLDGTVQDKLEELATRIGHGLSVDSVDGRLISYSTQNAQADAPRVASILSRRVAPEIQEWQNRHGIARATVPVRIPANAELGMAARLCVPIRHGHRCLGYLWVLEGEEALAGAALDAVTTAVGELARLLGGPDGAQERDTLVRRLLEAGQPGARDGLADLIPSLIGAQVRVCAAVPISRRREHVPALTAAEFQRLGAPLSGARRPDPAWVGSFVTATHLAVLLRHRPTGSEQTAALDRVLRSVARRPFAIGVSDPVPFEAGAARDAYAQARATAEVAALDPALPRILPWSQAGPYRILLRMAAHELDPVLTPLEQAEGSARILTRTLEAYLDLGCDAQRTAALLHLHRTTVYYRLGRIAELLGVDLGDGLVRSHLHLALKDRRLAVRPSL